MDRPTQPPPNNNGNNRIHCQNNQCYTLYHDCFHSNILDDSLAVAYSVT